MVEHEEPAFYWINRRMGNYRCLVCGFQFWTRESGTPAAHAREHRQEAEAHWKDLPTAEEYEKYGGGA